MSNIHEADKVDAKRWDALPFHSEDYFSYKDLAKQFKGYKSGRRIAIVMLKNAKRKGAIALAPNQRNIKGYNPIIHDEEIDFNGISLFEHSQASF